MAGIGWPRRPGSARRRFPHCLLAVSVVGLVALVGAHTASAWFTKGRPWPGGTIRYHNEARDQAWAVRKAASAWNRSGARVRFVATSRAGADIVIKHLDPPGCGRSGFVLGRAPVGYAPNAVVYIRRLDESSLGCNRYAAATAVAHEFGHILGLGHEDRYCALMNRATSLWGPSKCERTSTYEWRCQLVTLDDAAGAVHLYGGVARAPSVATTCRLWANIARPGQFRAQYSAEQVGVRLSFSRPRSPRLATFVQAYIQQKGKRPIDSFAFTSRTDRCPTNDDLPDARRHTWNVPIGGRVKIVDRLQPAGRYCYAVWALDGASSPSARPSLAVVTIPPH